MGVFFSSRELLNVAVGIEKNGAAFYDSLAASSADAAVQRACKRLADKEREHAGIFRDMLRDADSYEPPETLTEEYQSYLKALVDTFIFTDARGRRTAERAVTTDAEALQVAVGVEKDSILLYTEMRNLVRKAQRAVVGRVLEEERGHLRELRDLRKSLGKR